MKSSPYTLAFAAALGSFCALVLTGAGEFTAPYRKANARAEEMRNILGVLRVPHDPGLTSEELLEVFARNIDMEDRGGLQLYLYGREKGGPVEGKGCQEPSVQSTRKAVPAKGSWHRFPGRRGVKAVAVPFSGPGLWGPVEGFLALESDMRTIRGITFHKQEETPGLGGEIAAASFRRQFEGKSIVDESGRPGIRILRGGRDKSNKDVQDGQDANGAKHPANPVHPCGKPFSRGGATEANEVDGITGATTTCEKVQEMLNEIIARIAKAGDADAR